LLFDQEANNAAFSIASVSPSFADAFNVSVTFPADADNTEILLRLGDFVKKLGQVQAILEPDSTSSMSCPWEAAAGTSVRCFFQPRVNDRQIIVSLESFVVFVNSFSPLQPLLSRYESQVATFISPSIVYLGKSIAIEFFVPIAFRTYEVSLRMRSSGLAFSSQVTSITSGDTYSWSSMFMFDMMSYYSYTPMLTLGRDPISKL